MRDFLVADLNAAGELRCREMYSYAALDRVPGASDLIAVCSAALWRDGDVFEINLDKQSPPMTLRWAASSEKSGIATVRSGMDLISLSLLVCGVSPDADQITLRAFQTHLVRELHDTGFEPSFALLDLDPRPLVATINFRSPDLPTQQHIAALIDRCFAAAYFRYQRLA